MNASQSYCEHGTYMYYVQKYSCDLGKVEYKPSEDCLLDGLTISASLLNGEIDSTGTVVTLGDLNTVTFEDISSVTNISQYSFKTVCEILSAGMQNVILYSDALIILNTFCIVLKDRVSHNRKMNKMLHTIDACEL